MLTCLHSVNVIIHARSWQPSSGSDTTAGSAMISRTLILSAISSGPDFKHNSILGPVIQSLCCPKFHDDAAVRDWTPQYTGPQAATTGERRQSVDSVHESRPGFVDTQEVGHVQVPHGGISVEVVRLYLEDPRQCGRAINAGADHVLGEQFSILVHPQALATDAEYDALVEDNWQWKHFIFGGNHQFLASKQPVWVEARVGFQQLPDGEAHFPPDCDQRVAWLYDIRRGLVADN